MFISAFLTLQPNCHTLFSSHPVVQQSVFVVQTTTAAATGPVLWQLQFCKANKFFIFHLSDVVEIYRILTLFFRECCDGMFLDDLAFTVCFCNGWRRLLKVLLTGNSDRDIFQVLVRQRAQKSVQFQQIKHLPKTGTTVTEVKKQVDWDHASFTISCVYSYSLKDFI